MASNCYSPQHTDEMGPICLILSSDELNHFKKYISESNNHQKYFVSRSICMKEYKDMMDMNQR